MSDHIRLITFDLDDTLWDVKPALELAEAAQWHYLESRFPSLDLRQTPREQIAEIRTSLLTEEPALAHHISQFRRRFISKLLHCYGVEPIEADHAASEAFARFYEDRHRVAVYEGALTVLTTLRQRYRLGALTNGNADVRKTPIGACFDFAWRAEEFGVSKPDPRLFHQAFAAAGVAAREVVHIGDCHDNDVSGAIDAGAQAIWFNPAGDTSPIGCPVVTQLSELPAAVYSLKTPE